MLENHEISNINIKKIQANPWNPNKMPVGTYKKLLSSIKKLGLINAIVVRKLSNKLGYEVIDGEHRWKAFGELGYPEIPCKVIEASDEDVKAFIFATGIKGKHESNASLVLIEGIAQKGDSELLEACNLDNNKVKRLTKYSGISKTKSTKHLKDEKDTQGVEPSEDYRPFIIIPVHPSNFERLTKALDKVSKNHEEALLQLTAVIDV
jgi:hypothetical protein